MSPILTILFFFGLFEIGLMITVMGASRLMKADEQAHEALDAAQHGPALTGSHAA